jgi:hypothetical protein
MFGLAVERWRPPMYSIFNPTGILEQSTICGFTVDLARQRLVRSGIGNLGIPHFLGLIQEFRLCIPNSIAYSTPLAMADERSCDAPEPPLQASRHPTFSI